MPETHSLIYMPTEADLQGLLLSTNKNNKVWEVPQQLLIKEKTCDQGAPNLSFNVEYGKLFGTKINLSKL